jgi:hypothetical protein
MPEVVLLDNDVILKICSFGLVDDLFDLFVSHNQSCWILGVAEFVIGKHISTSKRIANRHEAAAAFQRMLQSSMRLEPNADEIALAALFESHALIGGADLDPGESLLLAVLLRRSAHLLITGDKRAIRAVHQLALTLELVHPAAGRLVCLEQVMVALCDFLGFANVAIRVCSAPLVDQAMAICFGCATGQTDEGNLLEGLCSYISHLRGTSGDILSEGYAGSPAPWPRRKTA